jgi:hypothetical protein
LRSVAHDHLRDLLRGERLGERRRQRVKSRDALGERLEAVSRFVLRRPLYSSDKDTRRPLCEDAFFR